MGEICHAHQHWYSLDSHIKSVTHKNTLNLSGDIKGTDVDTLEWILTKLPWEKFVMHINIDKA